MLEGISRSVVKTFAPEHLKHKSFKACAGPVYFSALGMEIIDLPLLPMLVINISISSIL